MSECDLFAAMFLLWEWNICVIDNWSSQHRGHGSFALIRCKVKGFMLEGMFFIKLSLVYQVISCVFLYYSHFRFVRVFLRIFLTWIVVSLPKFHSLRHVLNCFLLNRLVDYSLQHKFAFTLNYDKALIRFRFLSKDYITVFVFLKFYVWTQNHHCIWGQIFEEFGITHAHNLLI